MSSAAPRPHLLYVEDNAACGELVREALAEGYNVQLANDGFTGLDLARENPPDLLLVDLRLPTLSGFALIEQWRRDETLKPRPVVVISARVMGGEKDRARELGCLGFVEKPFSLETLRGVVARALSGERTP